MPLKVLIGQYLAEHYVQQIREVEPEKLEVLYDKSLLEAPPHKRTPDQEQQFRTWLAQADVLYGLDRSLAPELARLAPNLKWVQAAASGIHATVTGSGLHQTDILITNAAGVQAIPLAEHVLLSALYFAKRIPRRLANQAARQWDMFRVGEVRDKTAVVVGLGGAGREIARLLKAVGMRVIGVRRQRTGTAEDLGIDELHGADALHAVLPRCDYLVLIVPGTPETEAMIGARELALLPRGAVLINVGRGSLVDEAALVESLQAGHLGGAALDVTRQEPLPADSPLWGMPNVLLTPHAAAHVDREEERLTQLFCENLRRFLSGTPLVNVFRP